MLNRKVFIISQMIFFFFFIWNFIRKKHTPPPKSYTYPRAAAKKKAKTNLLHLNLQIFIEMVHYKCDCIMQFIDKIVPFMPLYVREIFLREGGFLADCT